MGPDSAFERRSARDARKRRQAARARLFRIQRRRDFREHPFVCWGARVWWASAVGLLVACAVISWTSGGRLSPLLFWSAIVMLVLPQIWVAVALRQGPWSPKRRARAEFWKGARFTLWMLSASVLFKSALVLFALVSLSRPPAATSGQSAWAHLWELYRPGGMLSAFVWLLGGNVIVLSAMLYAAYRLGPFIRKLEGKCVRCGYLLRGLPEPRCPECGTPFDPDDLRSTTQRRKT